MEFYLTTAKRVLGNTDREAPIRIFEVIYSWLESYVGLWGACTIILGSVIFYLIIVRQAINKG